MAYFADFSQDDDHDDGVEINLGSESSSQVVDQLVSTTSTSTTVMTTTSYCSRTVLSVSTELVEQRQQQHQQQCSPRIVSPDPSHHAYYDSTSSFPSSIVAADCAFLDDSCYPESMNINGNVVDDDDYSTSEESDISAFLEYARDVVAHDNAPYDPKAFRDFEQLLGECLRNHFLDEDEDQDSLVSIPQQSGIRFCGYDEDTTPHTKRALLNKPMISERASRRIKGVIATKKMIPSIKPVEQPLTTINGSLDVDHRKKYLKPEMDSDDSLVVPPSISVQSLIDSRVSKDRVRRDEGVIISDSSENEEEDSPRPKRPKRHRTRKSRKAKRDLPPRKGKTSRHSSSSKRVNDTLRNISAELSTEGSPYGSGGGASSISALLSSSPSDKEKVLQFLRKRAPGLYASVKERMERELRAKKFPLEKGKQKQSEDDSGSYFTPDKLSNDSRAYASSVSSSMAFHNRLSPEHDDQNSNSERIAPTISHIDTSGVILPSCVKAGISFPAGVGAPSETLKKTKEDERIVVFLTEGIELVLQDMLKKQFQMKSQHFSLNSSSDGLGRHGDNMAMRGMAYIHKFRAKRKAVLQAKFMEHSHDPESPEDAVAAAQNSTNSISTTTQEQVQVKISPQQLDPYMVYEQASTSNSSPASSIEEQKEKLKRVKENLRRSLPLNARRRDSRQSLLQDDLSPVDDLPDKNSVSSDGVNSLSKASPFKYIKFPGQKKDCIYEVLSPESSQTTAVRNETTSIAGSDDDSPLLTEHSPSSSDLTSSLSTELKNSSFQAGGLRSDDINKILIDPQSPECLSPIRDCRISDFSDSSMTWHGEGCGHPSSVYGCSNHFSETNRNVFDLSDVSCRIPTIFEDNSSTSHWSEMSFQTEFPEDSNKRGSQNASTTFLSSVVLSKRIEEVFPSENLESSEYNDSFDAIVSRETPSQKLAMGPETTDESPTGVTNCLLALQPQKEGSKNVFLSFVDDEDDILFTDKEDSFAVPNKSPLSTPVFLTTSRFEI